jgi:transcriptional regulator of acetoin/glycerol metabolism
VAKQQPQPRPSDVTDTVKALLDRAGDAGSATGVRDDIVGSWRRSADAGLRPEVLDVPFHADVDDRGRLAWAATPVLSHLAADLDGTPMGLLLTDERGLVLARHTGNQGAVDRLDEIRLAPGFDYGEDRVGTNAIGTALKEMTASVVQAEEHFADAFTHMACAAMTVVDPRTGLVIGTVDLSCAAAYANPLMLPLAKRAAWEIEQRLLDEEPTNERALLENFRRATKTTRKPVIAISRRSVLVNTAATDLLGTSDHQGWWEEVRSALIQGQRTCALTGQDAAATSWRCAAVVDGGEVVGALLSAESSNGDLRIVHRSRRSSARDFGWESLTDTEFAVAEHVSAGMTNREAAARLFVSPHTIDFHLRQLFRKLNVRSRVELTRIVLQRQGLSGD